ncbi:hypothetical protein [Methylovulum sp.]|uniref:hypothetical protein n=1 Tax=Methylovulum sp. TaxID=1916980 RepID=UPI00261DC6CA|nr:hypothetical protein [Methylovulum sp.]MDD5126079.1 hypothetical protein [Methylovulum sp.]
MAVLISTWDIHFDALEKCHHQAQQASQRDCPPFRLAKLFFFTGKRLRCKQSRGQLLTVTLGCSWVKAVGFGLPSLASVVVFAEIPFDIRRYLKHKSSKFFRI